MNKIRRCAKIIGLALTWMLLISTLVPRGVSKNHDAATRGLYSAREQALQSQSPQKTKPRQDQDAEATAQGRIAFASDRDGNFEIYIMNPDGSGLFRVTNHAAEDVQPTWSPDGTKIAFVSNRDGNKEIYVVGADGTGLTRLTTNTDEDIEPAYSPSVTTPRIAFVSHRDGNDEVYVMNADGTGQTNLSQNPADDNGPAWAPSAMQLAFASNRDGDKFEIYRMNSDGSGPMRLTNNSFNDSAPAWPPARISFQTDRDGNDEIYTMNIDGTNQTRITNNAAFDLDPARSSDGARLVFVSNRDEAANLEIYAANADGSNVVRLTSNPASDIDPAVEPLPSAATLGTIQLSAASFAVGEGQGGLDVSVTRTGGTGSASVDFATVSGTASDRSDFTPIFRRLTFVQGETNKTVRIPIIDDGRIEGVETFGLTLSDPLNAVLGNPFSASVTINDNDTSVAAAVSIFGVTAANNLVRFQGNMPGTIDSTLMITGLQMGETIHGLDLRPATGQLYALGSTGRLYVVSPVTGAATQASMLSMVLNGTAFGIDFNPTVDRLRLVSEADANARANVDTGAVTVDTTLAYAMGDPGAGQDPNVTGVAYTNNFAGATTTTLYGIDSARDTLVRQGSVDANPVSPNSGQLFTVGALGVDTTQVLGFDITNAGGIAFAVLTVGGTSQLYTINLNTGAATLVGSVGGGSQITAITAASPPANPIDDAEFFVRQQYLDFLNREPDPGGLSFWSSKIIACGSDAVCINRERVGVSAAFFLSPEFQETGGFIIRLYRAAFNRQPTFLEFLRERSRLAISGNIEANKLQFLQGFVDEPQFATVYNGLTNAQFVDALNANTGNSLTMAEPDAFVMTLNNGMDSRINVLRQIVDNAAFRQAQFNAAFVLMEYFGYLRRDIDPGGFAFWLGILNSSGNPNGMVCAFIASNEYQQRFSSVRTRTDSVCAGL